MSITIKRILFCTLGFLASLLAWPLSELVLYNQGIFSNYIIFSLIQGAILGLILGMFFGAMEGVLLKKTYFLKWGLIIGGLTGIVGGSIGGLIGQKILLVLGNNESSIFLSRAISLGILGIFIGMTEGIRSKSSKKIIIGFFGGLIGGLIGGFTIEYLKYYFPNFVITRLLGIMIFTTLIGVFYAIIEKKLSFGKVRVLNGELKGREFNISQKRTTIGCSEKCDITLTGYSGILDRHITITENKGQLYVKKIETDSSLIINDNETDNHILKFEDVIRIGSVKIFFKSE